MSSNKSKGLSDNILRQEMEAKMTEEERIVWKGLTCYLQMAAKMARIAEMAEKRASAPKPNPILQEIIPPQVHFEAKINRNIPSSVSWILLHLNTE